MTIFKSVIAQTENTSDLVAKILCKGVELKYLLIYFRLVKVIKEYHCKRSVQLTFLMGQLIFRAIGVHSKLILSDEFEIPMYELHFVDAEIDTLCLLFQR